MDISDLKSVWKKANDQQKPGYWVSEEDIRQMITKQSKAAIAAVIHQLRRKVRMSTVIGFTTLLVGIIVAFFAEKEEDFFFAFNNVQYGIMMLIMSISILSISVRARKSLKQVLPLDSAAYPLKTALAETNRIFKRLIRSNTINDTIVAPGVGLFGVGVGLYDSDPFAWDVRLLYMLIAAIVLVTGFYALARFMMNRKFGRFFRSLEQRLEEVKGLETDKE